MNKESWRLLLFLLFLIITAVLILINQIRNKKIKSVENMIDKEIEEIYWDDYAGFIDRDSFLYKLNKNKLINKFGKTTSENSKDKLEKLFNDAKNPWGITPTIFRGIRIILTVIFSFITIFSYFLFDKKLVMIFFFILTCISYFYPMYYYKTVAKEREQEWDKIYEFIWLIKYMAMINDSKKVFIETKNYIASNYPQYKEIITGLSDFSKYWDEKDIPDYIKKYYDFSIPKELYVIMFNMANTGVYPGKNLDNLRTYAINKHNGLIQSILSTVPSKATVFSLPFLMLSVVVALLIPMIMTFIKLM